MVYTNNVFEWDDAKARTNALKHFIRFEEATEVFDDPEALAVEDPVHLVAEKRNWLIGETAAGRLIVVVFTVRPGPSFRLISARPAGREERSWYEEQR
jgi:uncharacterized DUF497 family protein